MYETLFEADDAVTPEEINLILSQYLAGRWRHLVIVKIDRINNQPPTDSGWLATYVP